MKYFVYFLCTLDEDVVLYVGRAMDPKARWLEFIRREGVPAIMTRVDEYSLFESACQAELDAIAEFTPLYNQRRISSRGGLGSVKTETTKAKIRASMLGRSPSNKGKPGPPCSEEKREKLRSALKGRTLPPFTAQHRLNISKAMKGHHAVTSTPSIRPAPNSVTPGRVPLGTVPVVRRRIKV